MGSEQPSYDELQRERDRFVAFGFTLADGFVELDSDQMVRYAAGALKPLLGIECAQMAGRNFLDFILPEDHAALLAAQEASAENGQCGPVHLRVTGNEGDAAKLLMRGARLSAGGGLFLSIARDDGTQAAEPISKSTFAKKTIPANQMLFDEGDPADLAYILRSGAVEIRVGNRGDHPSRLATIAAGDVFGELALLESRTHNAAAVTTTESEVLEVPRKEFIKRLNGADPIMKTVVNHLVRRLREMNADVETLRKSPWGG